MTTYYCLMKIDSTCVYMYTVDVYYKYNTFPLMTNERLFDMYLDKHVSCVESAVV